LIFKLQSPPIFKKSAKEEELRIEEIFDDENTVVSDGRYKTAFITCTTNFMATFVFRDDGVSDEVWQELEMAKQREKEELERIEEMKR
jgi:hypothetical protein